MPSLSVQQRVIDSTMFAGAESVHPVLARVYKGRRLTSSEELDYNLAKLVPPGELKGVDNALELLTTALAQQQRILIVGDFDVDGATSTVVAKEILEAFGAQHVDYLVPDRFKYGYGLTPEIVEVALDKQPQLIITVDNGIASVAGVAAAKERGIKVLVTDHHLPGQELPEADAIVNPNQPGDEFESKSLAGVGVIFYLMMALRTRLREQGWFDRAGTSEPNLGQWLDLVALGTVADMVKLDYNNRILVANGLARICGGYARPGIKAILKLANRDARQLSSIDLGFIIAPRINAAGRLDDMSVGIECLLSETESRAMELASQLENLNAERRGIQADMQQQAMDILEKIETDNGDDKSPGICLYDATWHQGVVGLIASKLKEHGNRPAIVFARGDNGDLKGSARSVRDVHIRDLLDSLATNNPGLLIKFGGHAMAAGLSIAEDRFQDFVTAFHAELLKLGSDYLAGETILTDGQLVADEINLETAETIRAAGPWGQGFPEPLFEGRFQVVDTRILKDKHAKFRLQLDSGKTFDAISFNTIERYRWSQDDILQMEQIDIVYRLDVNEFRGNRNAQLIIDHITTTS